MSSDAPLERLRLALPELPPRLRHAARYLVDHAFDATTRSMRELAADAGVTPASFTRLAQALGYSGWEPLRAVLVEARRPAAPFSGRARARDDLPAAMMAADAAALGRLEAGPVAAAAAALHAAPRIWCAGFRSCRAVAGLLHYQLRLFRPEARLVGAEGPEELDLEAFAASDAVVLASFAPYSAEAVRTAAAARRAGATLVALADSPVAPVSRGAAHLLHFEADGPGFFHSLAGAVSLAQALAAASFALGGAASMERLCQAEARLAELSRYASDKDYR
ncbi:MurR/RpiR family transcriptional regulator [Roseomonas xinghualingensis]|uniref:MurR/RpiR family transcriptional regulator n=1 Tax=Roseomonas xinghualingensis TaxID=2986475 RepID=UPI0021F0B97F|nr:MurR/RpiR family transcriptional regulator [Roseomonas sp. SXEYE001]MCV4206123.1 MurR/RpiR family transcriptional regulator [Roseomonas sp. SXEYE001]